MRHLVGFLIAALLAASPVWAEGVGPPPSSGGGGSGGVTIGQAVTGGTPSTLLYNNASGNIANSATIPFSFTSAAGSLATSQPFTITQTWNAAGVVFTGLIEQITNPASQGSSLLINTKLSGAQIFGLGFDSGPAGTNTRALLKAPGGFHFQDVVTDTAGGTGLLGGADGIVADMNVAPGVGHDGVETYLSGEFTSAASGNHPLFASVVIDAPSGFVLGGATATNLAALFINGSIPIPGGLTVSGDSYALLVAAGGTSRSWVQGLLAVGNQTDALSAGGFDTASQLTSAGTFTGAQMLRAGGNLTASAATDAQSMLIGGQVHAAQNKKAFGLFVKFTDQLFTSGTHPLAATADFEIPLFGLNGAAVTEATTVYIAGAPTAGSTSNFSLHVAAGSSSLDGTFLNPGITTDATKTDATVCEDTTTHQFYSGSGTLGICLGTSSLRFKDNVVPLAHGLADLMRLQTIAYNYKSGYGDPSRRLYGFAAEQVYGVLPELVALNAEGQPNSVDWAGIVPVIVHAIQEQQSEIDGLRHRRTH